MSKSHSTKDGYADNDDAVTYLYLKEMVGRDIAGTVGRLMVSCIISKPYVTHKWYSNKHKTNILAYCRYLDYYCVIDFCNVAILEYVD